MSGKVGVVEGAVATGSVCRVMVIIICYYGPAIHRYEYDWMLLVS